MRISDWSSDVCSSDLADGTLNYLRDGGTMGRFIEGYDRSQPLLLPACVEDYVSQDSLVRVIDAFVETIDLTPLGFESTVSAQTGRPGYPPGELPRLSTGG